MTKVRTAVAVAVVLAVALVAPAVPAGAAGMTTHAWMAESAIDLVDDPDLAALLRAHVDQVRSGARFPDGGYGPGLHHGEEAHWQRFTDAYADIVMARDCGDLADPDGPCAAEVAHLMGVVAHGTGDEVWDWLFEPYSPDLGEYYLPDELSPFQDGGGQELVMDLVAIGVHERPGGVPPPLPSVADLLAAFEAAGHGGVTEQHLANGQAYIDLVYRAESIWASGSHLQGVLEAMPWMSANLVTAPGGVEYAARAIAGQWDAMWGRLQGAQPPTEVSITHPADGQTGVPATGWVRTYLPGSHPGRGGARTRIAASLTHALPFDRPGQPAGVTVPPGSMAITERGSGAPVPLMAGYPRAVPYSPSAGEHTIAVQPAVDLVPCTWYRVDLTDALLDSEGRPVVPHSWEFRTGLDADGTACPDDPVPAPLLAEYVTRAHRDLLGRDPSASELDGWVAELGGGGGDDALAEELVGSAEHRRLLAEAMIRGDLGRAPTTSELDVWSQVLLLVPVDEARALLLGTPEALTRAGGPEGWVDHVYGSVFDQAPTEGERAWWAAVVRAGGNRTALARTALAQPVADAATARRVMTSLLGRAPTDGELAEGTSVVAGSGVRGLARWVVAGAPYSPLG